MPRVETYMFAISQQRRNAKDGRLDKEATPDVTLRPSRMTTLVERRGLVLIDGLYIDGNNQIVTWIDAYQWSMKLYEEVQSAFLKEHGLTGKTIDEIDTYLTRHKLHMPDPLRIDLPTIKVGTKVRVTGKFSDVLSDDFLFSLTLIGPAYRASV